jgi:hypothetical protein
VKLIWPEALYILAPALEVLLCAINTDEQQSRAKSSIARFLRIDLKARKGKRKVYLADGMTGR